MLGAATRSFTRSGAARLALTAAVLSLATAARADVPPVTADVSVTVSPELDEVRGTVRLLVTNATGAPLDHVDLWRFPERLAQRPRGMSEVSEDWVFPGAFEPGGMALEGVRDGAGRALTTTDVAPTLARVALPAPLAPGARVTLEVAFRTRVPHRFGPFGHANGELVLDGGFFPRPPPQRTAPSGFAAELPPAPLAFRLALAYEGEAGAWALANGRMERVGGGGSPRELARGTAERVSVALLTEHHLSTLRVDGAVIAFVHRRPRAREARYGELRDLSVIDIHAQTLATVGAGLRHWQRVTGTAPPRRVVLVEACLRRDLAIGAPGMTLVSDRAFEVLPLERLRKFHRVAVLRALYQTLLAPTAGRGEGPATRARVRDLVAVDLAERWEHARYEKVETARAVLAYGSFLAAIDQEIYAPQLPFQSAYFRGLDDTDRLRDRFELFSHRYSNGRLLYEKVRDVAGTDAARALADAVRAGRPLAEALAAVEGVDDGFLARWSGRYPAVNYRLEAVREAGGATEVEVVREGAALREPVVVEARGSGKVVRQTWDGRGERGVVRFEGVAAGATAVQVDPDLRLAESDLGANVDPRADNRNFDAWKLLLQGFAMSFSSVGGRLEASITGILQREHDLTHMLILQPFEAGTETGLASSWYYGFGPKNRPNQRRYSLSTHLTASRTKRRGDVAPGFGAKLSLGFGYNDQLSRLNPRRALRFFVQAGANLAVAGEDTRLAGFALLDASRVFDLADGHKLGARLHWASLFGSAGLQQQWSLGGPFGVRAFDLLAQTGRHRGLVTLEWRHRYSRDLSLDLAHLAFVTAIDGAFFVDAALLGGEAAELFSSQALFVGVGYGLRFYYLAFGTNPLMLRADVAVPVFVGRPLAVAGALPISFVLAIQQPF